ncbi:unnamed protein product, partial [Cylicostephanus goldi]
MVNFFRKFIQSFATIAAPLYELTKDNVKFEWGSRQQHAFDELRNKLITKPCLAFPQERDFILHTDGSQIAVGAALFQQSAHDEKSLVAIGYYSKALTLSQQKWSPTHVELFAMVSALRFFKATIYGHLTRIFSDHRPLTYLLKHNKTHDNLARWVVELQSYNITIEYLKGSSNVVADCLSRSVTPQTHVQDTTPESEDIVEFPVCLAVQNYRIRSLQPTDSPITPIAIKPYDALLEQKQDLVCNSIMSFLETGKFPDHVSEADKASWLKLAEDCHIRKNGCLYHLANSTAGGHFNWRKTLAKVARKYFWPHMSEQIFALSKACDPCQRKRAQAHNREELLPVATTTIFDKVYMDLTGPLHTSESGNKYVLAMLDHFSKYVIVAPLPDCSAVTVAHAIMTECILKFGAMT